MLVRRELRVALGALAAGALAVVAIAKVFGPEVVPARAMPTPASPANAPSYAESRKVIDAISRVIDRTNLWHQMSRVQRLQEAKDANTLRLNAERLFGDVNGPFGRCTAAAAAAQDYVQELNRFSDVVEGLQSIKEPHQLFFPMSVAVRLGNENRLCRQSVESINAKL